MLHAETWVSHPAIFSVYRHRPLPLPLPRPLPSNHPPSLPDLLGGRWHGTMRTTVLPGDQRDQENIFGLSDEDLGRRRVTHIDIAEEMFPSKTANEWSQDLGKFRTKVEPRGPLLPGWPASGALSTTYTLVTASLVGPDIWPSYVYRIGERMTAKVMWRHYRKMFVTMDSWIAVTLAEVRRQEAECAALLPEHLAGPAKEDATSIS